MRSRVLRVATAALGTACLLAPAALVGAGSAATGDPGATTESTTTVAEPAETTTTTTVPVETETVATTAPATTTAQPEQQPAPRYALPALAGTFAPPEPEPAAPAPAGVPAGVSGYYHLSGRVLGPLTTAPPLHGGPYVFPVAGGVAWGDSYGAARSDVPGGWHHGDDIFARLGQPVLAVAEGKVYSVGWERLGGWRLWLRDREGNRFYYAHLSGYTRLGQNERRVRAGDVVGFIGHTGDAFTTPPHLHFEIHPSTLLRLRYDGAVDPTSYLQTWGQVARPHVPLPAPLPRGASAHGEGAVSDYRRLLALRARRAPARALPPIGPRLPEAAVARVAPVASTGGGGTHWLAAALAGALALAAIALVAARRR